jgi:hypothetical protein
MLILMTLAKEDISLANQQETQAQELDAVSSAYNHLRTLNYSC